MQWGDEGKGRIVDLYADRYDVIARFAGGDNAGHSIVVGERELALRIVPSGVMHPNVDLFVGGGTVVSLSTLLGELDALAAIGVDIDRVKISDRAQVVFPYHVTRDQARERKRGGNAIGTTGRGIGPAYEDRVARTGIRFDDLLQEQPLAEKLWAKEEAADQVISETLDAARRLRGHIVDGVAYIHDRLGARKTRALRRRARARCSTSAMEPIRSSPARTRLPAAPAPDWASVPTRSATSSACSKRTARASARGRFRRSCSTNAANACAARAASSAPLPAGRGAAAGSTRSRRATPSRSTV